MIINFFGTLIKLCKNHLSRLINLIVVYYRSTFECAIQIQIFIFLRRFFIDDTPIRVFKNYTNLGVPYPRQPMRIEATLWNGDWASPQKINWAYAPFRALYQGFDISGCSTQSSNVEECYKSNYWWNNRNYWELNPTQKQAYENVRKKYMNYDYCNDKPRFPFGLPKECNIQKN